MSDIEPDLILFGVKGTDDWAFAPDVVARLEDSGLFILLEDEDEDQDPNEADPSWSVVPGNQIVWIDDGDQAEPLALIPPDKAGDQATLEEVAREWARGAEGVEIDVSSGGEVRAVYATPQ